MLDSDAEAARPVLVGNLEDADVEEWVRSVRVPRQIISALALSYCLCGTFIFFLHYHIMLNK